MSSIFIKSFYVVKTAIQVALLKALNPNEFICGRLPYFKGSANIEMGKGSKCELGCKIKMMDGVRIGVRENAFVSIGDRTSINVGTIIVCHDKIKIDKDVQIGPYCQFYDHDHKYLTVEDLDSQKFETSPISIGKHVWIGANCIILRGTVIGDHCVVAAGTVLKGTYDANTLIYSKREIMTKKIIAQSSEECYEES